MNSVHDLSQEFQDYITGTSYLGSVGMENLSSPLSAEPRSKRPVTACHVLLTAPYLCSHPAFSMTLHEQWTARLSALAWRRYNGPIHLITDRIGGSYIREIGLDQVYDSVTEDLLDRYGLNQDKYWASGKLLALKRLTAPCMILDMDLIVWRPLDFSGRPLVVAHKEYFNDFAYPEKAYFSTNASYSFPKEWDFSVYPFNTSILYLGDERLRQYYVNESIRFMRNERDTPDNGSNCMVFAEQRILAMCAASLGIKADTLLDIDDMLKSKGLITHTWNGKQILNNEPDVQAVFIALCQQKCRELEDLLAVTDETK